MGISIKKITKGTKKTIRNPGKAIKSEAKRVGKQIESGTQQLGSQAKKGLGSIGTGISKLKDNAAYAGKLSWKITSGYVDDVYEWQKDSVNRNIVDKIKPKTPDIPDPVAPAAPAPEPETGTQQLGADENISRRRKRSRRKGLRIDLNTGGAPSGSGVNLPVG